jgi:hypothetical protein
MEQWMVNSLSSWLIIDVGCTEEWMNIFPACLFCSLPSVWQQLNSCSPSAFALFNKNVYELLVYTACCLCMCRKMFRYLKVKHLIICSYKFCNRCKHFFHECNIDAKVWIFSEHPVIFKLKKPARSSSVTDCALVGGLGHGSAWRCRCLDLHYNW